MILVHKKFLEEQFEETIKRFVPNAKISKVRGDSCDLTGDFIIASIQTLLARKYDNFDGIGCLIVDESHHIAAESFSQTMFGISFKYVIGLSATPTRKDGLTRVLHWFMGTTAFEVRRTLQKNVMVKIIPFTHEEYRKPPPVNKRGDICYTSLITKICDIRDRTMFIAEETKKIAETGRHVLVLSHRRNHATEIKDILVSLGMSAATYLGGDKVEPDAQVICATYHLASEGYDNPRLSGLVLSTPSSDVVQACGRILRGGSGNDPVIVDIVDQYSLFLGQIAKRKTFYRKIGFNMGKDDAPVQKIEEQLGSMFIDDD
jgi:superfamily II DNA or RNA helicase